MTDHVPSKSLARMAYAKLQSRILSASEAVHAAKLHHECRGLGTGTTCTAMHKSPTEMLQNAQRRMATALRLGATPDAGLGATCALHKGNDGDMCEHSLAKHPFHPICCKFGEARARPHLAVLCTLHRLIEIEQAGGYADMERHVPELRDWVQKNNEVAGERKK